MATLPGLARSPGRPATPRESDPGTTAAELALKDAVLEYVMDHPGCVHVDKRAHYTDGFRQRVLELRAAYASMYVETFARAVRVPLGTIKAWLAAPPIAVEETPTATPVTALGEIDDAHVKTVLDAWSRWHGPFVAFCEHVRSDLRVPWGRALIGRVLHLHTTRNRAPRRGRLPDESALRGSFRTFFPGAQWVADGMQVPIVVDGQRFVFNLELQVDAHTGAFVGLSVRDQEDSAAVVESFAAGVATTGSRPLAELLDNRPSNHTPEVDDALEGTLRIRATAFRPENKGHVEGAFGLFSQVLPPLVFDTRASRHDFARALLGFAADVWARTTNHRPRRDRDRRSRVDLYGDAPTQEQVDEAKRELRETLRRQERRRRTLEARRRPDVLALLDDAFARLGLLDPERHIRIAIAGYPRDHIVDGIGLFDAKTRAGTLPDGADARYLLGIVRNLAAQAEGQHLAHALLELRVRANDRALASLVAARDHLAATSDPTALSADLVDRALGTTSTLERRFWLDALGDSLRALPPKDCERLYFAAATRIEATFATPPRERHDAVCALAARLFPLV